MKTAGTSAHSRLAPKTRRALQNTNQTVAAWVKSPMARAAVSRLRPRPWTAASTTMNRKSVAPSTGFSPMFQTMPCPAARWRE